MRKIISSIFMVIASLCFFNIAYSADEKSKDLESYSTTFTNTYDSELNFYTGMFDWSDTKQKSVLFGLQHQNDELFIKTDHSKISPITGAFITANNAFYLYTGIQAEYELGPFLITPSFAPGYYGEGNGKDLGSPLEFKSEIQMSWDISEKTHLGMSYNHISNASLGDKNPGANSYIFNFLKKF